MTGGQRHRGGPQPPTHNTHPLRFLSPQPTRAAQAPQTQKKARPPGTEPRSSRSRSRSARSSSSIPGGRGRARGRREGAIQRGCAGMLPGRPAAAVRLPSPASAAPSAAAGHAPPGLPARAPAWRGVARGGRPWTLRLRRGRRTDTRSKEAGGPESPAWGRSEAVAGGGGGGGVDSTAAAGLGTTFYIWPLVWGPRGRRGRRRETLGGGPVAAGSRPPGWRRTGPRRTMHLGVKPRLRVSGPRPRPLCFPATVEDRATKAEPPGPACPRGPSPAGLFRIRARRRRGGEGWC